MVNIRKLDRLCDAIDKAVDEGDFIKAERLTRELRALEEQEWGEAVTPM